MGQAEIAANRRASYASEDTAPEAAAGTAEVSTREARRRLFARLWPECRGPVVLAVVAGLLGALSEGVTVAILGLALDVVTGDGGLRLASWLGPAEPSVEAVLGRWGPTRFFFLLVTLGVVAQIARSALAFAGGAAAARLQSRVEARIRQDLFRRVLDLGLGHVRRFRAGDLAHLIDQVHFVGHSANLLNVLASQCLFLVAYALALFWLSWKGTLVALLVGGLAFVALQVPVRRVRRFAEAYKTATVRLSERAVELLHGLKTVLAFGAEKRAMAAAGAEVERAAEATRQAVVAQAMVSPLTDAAAVLGVGLALAAGYWFVGLESASMAAFGMFLFVLYRAVPRLSVINKNWAVLHNYVPFLDRTARFLAEEQPVARGGSIPFAGLEREVRFEDVAFHYPGSSEPTLEAIELVLRPGRTTAIVGPSGSGKSTIVDLLLGIYEPTVGRVRVDGRPLGELDWNSWRERIGVVSQGSFLFNDTVRANIALGRPGATPAEVEEAAVLASADEFIAGLPNGYDTELGDQGHRLSGGERQRIAIARAFLKQPDLLVLDEATSDLDGDTEARILRSLRGLRGRRALLIVAHRLSTIAEADEILVLHEGRIVERGSHAELLSGGGRYARLWWAAETGAPIPAPHR